MELEALTLRVLPAYPTLTYGPWCIAKHKRQMLHDRLVQILGP